MNSSKKAKSKPITTSVPSFAIRFHAGGEELEELYPSEEEEKSEKSISEDKSEKNVEKVSEKTENDVTTKEQNKHESSPMRDYLNKFGKRSSSIDTGINETTLNKETSDPWRIFSEFKGKLTKTVEEKLSEIKSKSSEGENSPKSSQKDRIKNNNSKESSSVSDGEEQSFSECSIAKSSGLNSTAEDLEMSSDDENSLQESEKTPTENKDFQEQKKNILRHRIKNKTSVEYRVGKEDVDSLVKISSLSTVHEKEDPVDYVESGVEACEDFSSVGLQNIQEAKSDESVVLVAPTGFVDLRSSSEIKTTYSWSPLLWIIIVLISFLSYLFPIPKFLSGFIFGSILTLGICYLLHKFKFADLESDKNKIRRKTLTGTDLQILEIPAAKEYVPMTKFEGWMNEYPDNYDPRTYHIMKTQSVFLKLEGSLLRISHTRAKIPKRAMWNESKHHVTFTHHRMYNLKGSQIMLLPTGLIHKRLWSKKYPICIILNKENMNLELNIEKKDDENDVLDEEQKLAKISSSSKDNENIIDNNIELNDESSQAENQNLLQNQLIEEEKEFFSDSFSDAILEEDNELSITVEDWDTLTLDETNIVETKIFLFARTCRDKEDWFRRLVKATHDTSPETETLEDDLSTPISQTLNDQIEANNSINSSNGISLSQESFPLEINPSETVLKRKTSENKDEEEEYCKFMARFNQVRAVHEKLHEKIRKKRFFRVRKKKHSQNEEQIEEEEEEIIQDNYLWFNSLIARIIYDVRRHNLVIERFQNLIQKKIGTIKLPYFIDSILLNDLCFGESAPSITNIQPPVFDERGLWLHLDVTYEGVTSMAIVTKLNLMKLKEQAGKSEETLAGSFYGDTSEEKSPIFHSDVEDSAESSDEEVWVEKTINGNDGSNQNLVPRKSNTGGKKFLQMVDKIASSKYFQQATENKYIKRAMEGVSKTEIKLTVEIQHLSGTLAINIPPPPSDRMWIGFHGNPELQLSALPTFGERSLNFMHVSKWIEKKLAVEFQKFLVLPNMEDFVLPMLIPKLPE